MLKEKKIALSVTASLILANQLYAKEVQSLDSITVTAQKVEENIQEVPLSITVFDQFSIEDKQIESVKDIAPYTSNFMMFDNSGGGSFTPVIRGIKARNTLSTSVGMYIDGVANLNINGFDETLMDIERIEVLKGPQGTLYGKDTIAGAINIITKKPNNETKGKVGVKLGSDSLREYTAKISGPLVKDKFFMGLALKHYEKDGFITNTNGGKTDDREHNYGKINFRYTPNDNLDISLISSLLKRDDGDNTVNGKDSIDRVVTNNLDTYDKSKTTSHALKISYDLDKYLLESITTNRKFNSKNFSNYHFSSNTDFHAKGDSSYDKTSQEFRISNSSDTFKYLIGVYGDKDDNKISYDSYYPFGMYPSKQNIKGDSLGIFLHSDYSINDKLSFISGVRYDKDDKKLQDHTMGLDLSQSDNALSPKISLKYQKDKNHMFYSTISKGYISGGFNIYSSPGYSKKFEKQTLWNYEIGIKNKFFNNRFIVNSSIFYMDISDLQVKTSPRPGQSYVSNAAEATSKGFEIDFNGKITDEIEVFGSYGYTNIEFDKFEDVNGDYSGNTNSYAPKYNYNLGLQYRDAKGYFARADINGYGKTYFNKENTYSRDAYNLVNTKIGYETENYDIYLYGKNIFDKNYDSIGAHEGYFTIYSPPREIGIQLAYRF